MKLSSMKSGKASQIIGMSPVSVSQYVMNLLCKNGRSGLLIE